MRCVVDVISHKDKKVFAQARARSRMPSPQIQLPYFQKNSLVLKQQAVLAIG
jgi:hypothetical protein